MTRVQKNFSFDSGTPMILVLLFLSMVASMALVWYAVDLFYNALELPALLPMLGLMVLWMRIFGMLCLEHAILDPSPLQKFRKVFNWISILLLLVLIGMFWIHGRETVLKTLFDFLLMGHLAMVLPLYQWKDALSHKQVQLLDVTPVLLSTYALVPVVLWIMGYFVGFRMYTFTGRFESILPVVGYLMLIAWCFHALYRHVQATTRLMLNKTTAQ